MANYPYYGYQPYQAPIPDQLAQLRQPYQPMQQPVQQGQSIVWVQNEQEAFNYLVAPNSAVALWDSNNPVIYLKQADAAGKPSMKIYDLVERVQRPAQISSSEYVTRKEFEMLTARVDELVKGNATEQEESHE